MTDAMLEAAAAEALAAAEELRAVRVTRREAVGREAAQKARLREEGLDELRAAAQAADDAERAARYARRLMYELAASLHDRGVPWQAMAEPAGKTAEAIIKGARSRDTQRPIAVPGLPQGWAPKCDSFGRWWSVDVDGVEYSTDVRSAARGVLVRNPYAHTTGLAEIQLTDDQRAAITATVRVVRLAAEKRSKDATARHRRRREA